MALNQSPPQIPTIARLSATAEATAKFSSASATFAGGAPPSTALQNFECAAASSAIAPSIGRSKSFIESFRPEQVGLLEAQHFIGLEYVDGAFDCADLVVLVQRELFGRNLMAPSAAERSRGVRGQARDLRSALASFVRPTPVPATGCAVLLWETTPHGVPPLNRRWHIGTVFMHLGAPWVLHCANETEGTRLQPLAEITASAMHFESFLEWL